MQASTILVTGGAGFIGANLVRHILQCGGHPRVLDDFSSGRWENLADLEPSIEVHEGDVRDLRALRRAGTSARAIFHLAAVPTLPDQDEARTLDVNVKGTLCALTVAKELKIPLVFASSAAVYGAHDAYLLHERMPPEPHTAIGMQKLAAENYCRLFHEQHEVKSVVLRVFHAFGPFEDGRTPQAGVVAKFAYALVSGRVPALTGDGMQTRDFIYVGNVCDAFLQAAQVPEAYGDVFNIGSGEATPLHLLYAQMADLAGVRALAGRAPAGRHELRHVRAALGRATSTLRFAPRIRLREGLEHTLAWHRARVAHDREHAWFTPGTPPTPAPTPTPATEPEAQALHGRVPSHLMIDRGEPVGPIGPHVEPAPSRIPAGDDDGIPLLEVEEVSA
jgi:UDP-glucose 4-epimerase